MVHDLVYWIVGHLGFRLGPDTPTWLHTVLHVTVLWAPLALILVLIARLTWRSLKQRTEHPQHLDHCAGLPSTPLRLIWRYTGREQMYLVAGGVVMMPVLYMTLELPKIIINSVINPPASTSFPMDHWGMQVSQTDHLVLLCAAYLILLMLSGALKFAINVYRGQVAERLLRRLRLLLLRNWKPRPGAPRKLDAIPLFAQEVEPVGGYAAEALATPVMQGGTFLTIVVFMFVQDVTLGLAALTLLPIQILIIPRLQRRVNELARERVRELRVLSGALGDLAQVRPTGHGSAKLTSGSVKKLQVIRFKLYRAKYFMKATNNFLTSLTPFFFYSIGGYLVIQDRLSLGALIAVLAAYKDFSSPLRDLFGYYELTQDVKIRYAEILSYFSRHTTASLPSFMVTPERSSTMTPDGVLASPS